jgi:hypothetical protein
MSPTLNPNEIRGLDIMIAAAVNLTFVAAPPTDDHLKELVQIPPRQK